jgi:hypothetical protein
MRHTKTRKLFRKNNKNSKNKTIKAYGGGTWTISDSMLTQTLDKNSIENIQIITFLLGFIKEADEPLKSIFKEHADFINKIDLEDPILLLNFSEKEYRVLIWEITEYLLITNAVFINSVVTILKDTLSYENFYNESTINNSYNILLMSICQQISNLDKDSNQESSKTKKWLQILIKILSMKSTKPIMINQIKNIVTILNDSKLTDFKKPIICLLNVIVNENLLVTEKSDVLEILKLFMVEEKLTADKYISTIGKLGGKIATSCGLTIATAATKSVVKRFPFF